MPKKQIKLQSILILFTTSLVLATLLCNGILSFRMFEKVMLDKIGNSRVDVLTQVSEKLTGIKSNAELLSNLYYYNENLTDLYRPEGYTPEEEIQITERFRQLEEISYTTAAVAEIDFYYTFLMENGYVYSSGKGETESLADCKRQLWFPDVEENGQTWVSTRKDAEGSSVVSIARALKDSEHRFIGLFLFNIYEDNFSAIYQGLSERNDIYIVDGSGSIVSHKNKDLLGIRFYDMERLESMFEGKSSIITEKTQKKYLFSIVRNPEMNWILAEEISQELLLDDVRNIEYRMVGVGTVIFLAGILICVYISRETIKPLGKLMYELENVGKTEDLEQEFTVHGWEEINKICEECNYMLRRIRSLVAEIKESEKKKRRAEMGFLQSQMSPHFLYNTLFSIRCLVDMGEKTKAIGIIDAFTSIMKYILSYKTEFVEVAQELKFLEDYAVLQRYRYGEQFCLELVCNPDLYQKKILRMILEPLVENSLFHGLSDEKEQIHVVVKFEIVNQDMMITITDDGVGFTDENCRKLNQKMRENRQSNMIGMNNIRDRLKTTFGEHYGLSIDINYTDGARVLVKMPVIE